MDHNDLSHSGRRSRSPTRRDLRETRPRSPPSQQPHPPSRHRSRSRDKDRHKSHRNDDVRRRSRSRSHSRSASPDSGSSSSESEDEKRRRKRKHHKRRRSRSRSKDRDRKARKKEKKERKKKKSAAVGSQWGKYGIITESDMYTKEPEFRAWLVEEQMLNPENMSKDQTRKEFAKFMEDFNTATLSHEKFYHMESYERRMSALRAGEFVPPADDGYDPSADMRAHQSKHKRQAVEQESYLSKEQLQQLRRVQQERVEAGKMKLLGMDIKQNMGIRMDGTMFDG
ncbi:hypothetical protein OF83DRAFT_437027 [Amylostereum chailletii]|nr:hypothetical protein OF83DRAFT_437027 [Amylostereum chailletii]